MNFIKKIVKAYKDKYVTDGPGASLATYASVNQVVKEANVALGKVADASILPAGSSSADLPPVMLKKTATSFTYPDGTVLQGWSIIGGASLSGQGTYAVPQCTLTIPCVNSTSDEPIEEFPEGEEPEEEVLCIAGFYVAYKQTGAVKCMVDATEEPELPAFEIVNDFSSGADMRKESTGEAVQSAYMGIFLTETEMGSGVYTVSLDVEAGTGAGPSTAEIFYQFEFLCYSEAIPSIS